MSNIYFDTLCSDRDRRNALYHGDIFVYSPSAGTKQLCGLAEQLINEAFAPHDPRTVDSVLSMEECAAILAKLKPAFIHHPECKRLLPEIICSIGGDPDEVYFDVPRLRSAYPTTYLTSGIAYAFHPHRDTWYSAPLCQINWWLPITEIVPQNCLGFYSEYFHRPLRNNSAIYNYSEWNRTVSDPSGQTCQVGYPGAAKAAGGHQDRLDQDHLSAGRAHLVLRGPSARDGAEHEWSRPLQHRL